MTMNMHATPSPVDLLVRLAQHKALGGAPLREHQWLVDHGELFTAEVGDVVNPKGAPVEKLLIVLSGHMVIRIDRGAGAHKVFEWYGGDVGGLLPFSRGAVAPGDAVAEERMEVIQVAKAHLPEMIRECPHITAVMVHAMVDRARTFTTSDQRDEKLLSLGRLAAGLAHELNNPASAAVRSSKTLMAGLEAAEKAARRLGTMRLAEPQLAAIDALHQRCRTVRPDRTTSAIQRADREEDVEEWLDEHGVNSTYAAALADTGVNTDALDKLATTVTGEALDAGLQWISAGCAVWTLTKDIEISTSRIYDIVGAVKGFTYMDHAPNPEPVDVSRGIEDTLMMLTSKARSKSVDVSATFAPDLPKAHAVGVELNQVWMNLLDNAIDAVEKGGHVTITAAKELGRVVVEIVDDGAGIPKEIQGRIFDPFFTTKGVGKGTGLGLDIVRRLVQRHEGAIDMTSQPGRTSFRVSLPAAIKDSR